MKIILVRHGQTKSNIKNVLDGQLPGELSRKGKEQAKSLGEKLRQKKIDIIYSSDLMRAKQTATIIQKTINRELKFDKLLRERNLGSFQGKPGIFWHKARIKAGKKREEFKPEGAEGFVDVLKRVKKFVKKIKDNKEKNVLIVTHDAVIKAFLFEFTGKNKDKVLETKIKNTEIIEINI